MFFKTGFSYILKITFVSKLAESAEKCLGALAELA
jgi:hypothetical protein